MGKRPCCLLRKRRIFAQLFFKKLGSNQGSKYRSAELGHFGLTVENNDFNNGQLFSDTCVPLT